MTQTRLNNHREFIRLYIEWLKDRNNPNRNPPIAKLYGISEWEEKRLIPIAGAKHAEQEQKRTEKLAQKQRLAAEREAKRKSYMKPLALMACLALPVHAATLTFSWDASPEVNLIGYRLYAGDQPGRYTNRVSLPTITSYTVATDARCFALTAVNAIGLESDYSNELMIEPPCPPRLNAYAVEDHFYIQSSTNIFGPWDIATNAVFFRAFIQQ